MRCINLVSSSSMLNSNSKYVESQYKETKLYLPKLPGSKDESEEQAPMHHNTNVCFDSSIAGGALASDPDTSLDTLAGSNLLHDSKQRVAEETIQQASQGKI